MSDLIVFGYRTPDHAEVALRELLGMVKEINLDGGAGK